MTPKQRFKTKYTVDTVTQCWVWQDYLDKDGYGQFWLNRTNVRAHRYSFVISNGEIDSKLVIDHLCKNRSCVNPNHMEMVTAQENYRRGAGMLTNKVKTQCKIGHPYDKNNTYWYDGRRQCNICRRARALNFYYKHKLKVVG